MCIYKTNLISAEGYQNAKVHFLKIRKTSELWISIKDVGNGLGVKNISDLVFKKIYGIYGEKINKRRNYKMTKKEIFKKFDNLNED